MALVLGWPRKFLVIGIRPCCCVGMVTWTTCHFKMRSEHGGNRSVLQQRGSTLHGRWFRCEGLKRGTGKREFLPRSQVFTVQSLVSFREIPYTDFPMHAISLYACWDGEHWVIMLPSEY